VSVADAGLIVSPGVRLTAAVAFFDESAELVAVTVTVWGVTSIGGAV
jgi:hypothetical protein